MDLNLSTIMDGLVLVLLAATIFYAARLSLSINNFRNSRKDMEKVLNDLSQTVNRAEAAIEGLRIAAREGGRDLQEKVNEAKALSDELQLMTRSGGNIANRLEKAVDVGGATNSTKPRRSSSPASSLPALPNALKENSPARGGGFAIRDSEFEREDDEESDEDEDEEWSGSENLQSRAEKELFDALRKNKKRSDAGGVS